MEYKGTIAFHSNNEPLLDPRIYDFVEYARDKCEKSTIFMYTNGTLLTSEGLVRLLKSLDFIVVDWYTDDLKTDYTDKFETWRNAVVSAGIPLNKLKIKVRKRDEVLSSRGGDSPNSKPKLKKNIIPCFEPYTTMVVRPDGKISMCKCDAYGEITMGDVNTNSLYEIWTSKEYCDLRKSVRHGRNSGKCNHCNFPVY
jgi:radical SAM protein with 4Fe4S-binding SPASM domain